MLHRISAEEGIVATAYERRPGPWSRVHQASLIHLFNPSSAIYTCPLAMTDGAAKVIEKYGDEELKAQTLPRLTTRDPDQFWTSGQWMTERTGGSDVSRSETIARREGNGFRLYGTKWFTSATTSEMALALARVEGAPEGSKGLSLFYVELRDEWGRLKNIQVNRLKDKLGTKALPTAEIMLLGTPAKLIGQETKGVRQVASMLNITRIYNSICAVSYLRRGLALARDYAFRRIAFGAQLAEQPLYLEVLARLQTEYEGLFLLTFRVAEMLGREETGHSAAGDHAVLRLLTPITKLFTAREAVHGLTEIIECFGGAGYVEDTGIPRILRDALVLPIWEGTTNVLSLDVLRAIEKENALPPFLVEVRERLSSIRRPELVPQKALAENALEKLTAFTRKLHSARRDPAEAAARALAYSLARLYTASLLLESAEWHLDNDGDIRPMYSLRRWCAQDLVTVHLPEESTMHENRVLGLDQDTRSGTMPVEWRPSSYPEV
jgi:alkylation response protein AidB-like acyl-CoA dehydrogenase